MMLAVHIAIKPRPMGCLNAAMRDLDCSADKIRWMIDEGKLLAFDIAPPNKSKQCLRILTQSIEHYRDNGTFMEWDWKKVFRLIIPHALLFIRGSEIQRALNCDPGHVENLVLVKTFIVVRKGRTGRGGSVIVTRESFEKWLWSRVVGVEL